LVAQSIPAGLVLVDIVNRVAIVVLAAEIRLRRFTAAVTKLDLSDCPLTGGQWSSDSDKDLTGITALFDALKTSTVTELALRKCRLGPASVGKLAEYVREATAAPAGVATQADSNLTSAGPRFFELRSTFSSPAASV